MTPKKKHKNRENCIPRNLKIWNIT